MVGGYCALDCLLQHHTTSGLWWLHTFTQKTKQQKMCLTDVWRIINSYLVNGFLSARCDEETKTTTEIFTRRPKYCKVGSGRTKLTSSLHHYFPSSTQLYARTSTHHLSYLCFVLPSVMLLSYIETNTSQSNYTKLPSHRHRHLHCLRPTKMLKQFNHFFNDISTSVVFCLLRALNVFNFSSKPEQIARGIYWNYWTIPFVIP